MTTTEAPKIATETLSSNIIPHAEKIAVNPYTEFSNIETINLKPSPEQQLARTSLNDIFKNLRYSPNSTNYSESTAYTQPFKWLTRHEESILRQMSQYFANLSTDPNKDANANYDIANMLAFHHDDKKTRHHQMLGTSYFAYGPIEDTRRELSEAHQKDELPTDELNRLAIRMISATAVRAHYLAELSASNQEFREVFKERPFKNIFAQNTISVVRTAARIENIRQPRVDAPLTSNHQ